jgi:ABC-type nitrate/sulfonate/bicarbonate transport system substrate-binding protein
MAIQNGARAVANQLTPQNLETLKAALNAGKKATAAIDELPAEARGIIYTVLGGVFLDRGLRILIKLAD